jgi:hypothetical protein
MVPYSIKVILKVIQIPDKFLVAMQRHCVAYISKLERVFVPETGKHYKLIQSFSKWCLFKPRRIFFFLASLS